MNRLLTLYFTYFIIEILLIIVITYSRKRNFVTYNFLKDGIFSGIKNFSFTLLILLLPFILMFISTELFIFFFVVAILTSLYVFYSRQLKSLINKKEKLSVNQVTSFSVGNVYSLIFCGFVVNTFITLILSNIKIEDSFISDIVSIYDNVIFGSSTVETIFNVINYSWMFAILIAFLNFSYSIKKTGHAFSIFLTLVTILFSSLINSSHFLFFTLINMIVTYAFVSMYYKSLVMQEQKCELEAKTEDFESNDN